MAETAKLECGTLFRAKVEKNVFSGDGLAHLGSEAIFLPGALEGETVIAAVTEVRKNFLRAAVREIEVPSPERIAPVCRYAGKCPGCSYGHCSVALETRSKLRQLQEFLAPVAPDCPVTATEPAPGTELGYRNKLRFKMRKRGGAPVLGYTDGDGDGFPIDACLLAHPEINARFAALQADPGFLHSMHDGMTLTFRRSAGEGVLFWRNAPGGKVPMLHETVEGRPFTVPPGGFFQVNPHGMQRLLELLKAELAAGDFAAVFDAYCGAGLFGAVAAGAGIGHVIGVELDAESAAAARENYAAFGARHFTVTAGDAARAPELADPPPGTLTVIDPPRGGLPPPALRALASGKTRDLIYVSCHPATLVRDLGTLVKAGFRLCRAELVPMFPRSAHFEVFTRLERSR